LIDFSVGNFRVSSGAGNNIGASSELSCDFRFAAKCVKNIRRPTPAIAHASAAVLPEFSYRILAFSSFLGVHVIYLLPKMTAVAKEKSLPVF
jgi:hypothetical protein